MIIRPRLYLKPKFSITLRGVSQYTPSPRISLQRAQFSYCMGNWQRPGKNSPAPPPLYLTQGEDTRYCFTCGRVISSKKSLQKQSDRIKYCSDSCRRRKPVKEDEQIEQLIASLLNGRIVGSKDVQNSAKSGSRRVVSCDEIEEAFYGDLNQELSPYTKDQAHEDNERVLVKGEETHSELPPGESLQPNKQLLGQQRAERRERIRRAARRAIVFGLDISENPPTGGSELEVKSILVSSSDGTSKLKARKCEAVQNGQVVEPSFAKGDFGIRWRE